MNRIAAIVPTHNDRHRLRLVLEGFALQGYPAAEVHVCDDGSEEESADIVESYRSRLDVRYHYLGPRGSGGRRAAIRNLGIRQARAERLLFVDGDCVPAFGIVAAHAAYGADHVAVLGIRRMVPMERAVRMRPAQVPGLGQPGTFGRECRTRWGPFMSAMGKRVPLNHGWAVSCHISYPGRLLASIGGFWEAFESWGHEDNEVGLRMSRAGCLCVPRPDLHVYHLNHPVVHHGHGQPHLFAMTEESDVVVRGVDLWDDAAP